jgi:hypothetical protein
MLYSVAVGAAGLAIGAPAAQASINIDDVSVAETNGEVDATFTVTRSYGLFAKAVEVGYTTVDGSAHAPGDYQAQSGTLSFPSSFLGGTQTRQVTVAVNGDQLDEPTETFSVALSGSELGKDVGVGTITDDDPGPTISVADAPAATEGGTATFAVNLSSASGRDVAVDVTTIDGTAVAPGDYTTRAGKLTIPAGALSGSIGVPLVDDSTIEPDEKFGLRISKPVNATLGRATGIGTIIDNDTPPPPPPADTAPGTTTPPATTPTTPAPSSSGFVPFGPPSSTGGGAATAPKAATTTSTARLGIGSPRLKRPGKVLVTLSCPAGSGRCNGRLTIFSRPNKKSKLKALRKERRLGRLEFSVPPAGVETKKVPLGRADQVLLLRAGRIQVRAYVVAKVGKGATKVRSVNGTLISRTNHS